MEGWMILRSLVAGMGCAILLSTSACIMPFYTQEQLLGRPRSRSPRGPYICRNASSLEGSVVGDGHCVDLIFVHSGAPASSQWKEGKPVKGTDVYAGTAIATFVKGKFSWDSIEQHAAIFIEQDAGGISVWDQKPGQPVQRRM